MPLHGVGESPLRLAQQEKFALAISQGMAIGEAYRAAGYRGKGGRSAVLKAKKHVAARIEYLKRKAADRVIEMNVLSRSEIIESLRSRRERAMRGNPILNRDGTPTGEYKEDFSAGNRCDELLGRTMAMFVDAKVEENLDDALKGKDIDELREQLAGEIHDLDPNLHKQRRSTETVDDELDESAPAGTPLQ